MARKAEPEIVDVEASALVKLEEDIEVGCFVGSCFVGCWDSHGFSFCY